MELNVRQANEADNPYVKSISEEVQKKHAQARPDQHTTKQITFEDVYKTNIYQNPKFGVFVATVDEKIVGYMIVRIVDGKPHFEGQRAYRYLYLHEIGVADDYQNRNIGEKLFKYSLDFARENQASSIELGVWEFNQEAIRFYEKLGFTTKTRRMEMKI